LNSLEETINTKEAEMESSTKILTSQDATTLLGNWEQVQESFGTDLEESAHRNHALQRSRKIRSASDLLRLILVFCMEDWSLKMMGAWALLAGLGCLSDVAILKRLRNCSTWLSELVFNCLQKRSSEMRMVEKVRVSLVDASVINAPGSKGTEWRLHLKLDLEHRCVAGVTVTDAKIGETLARLSVIDDEIVVADRGYASARGIGTILHQGGHVVVRINWQSLPIWVAEGQKFALIDWLKQLSSPAEQLAFLDTPQGCYDVRVLACPLPPQEAEEARRRARQAAHKKKHTISDATLLAAGFMLIVTDLPITVWPIQRIYCLYRLRWQVELQFKTFKSLLHFDHLRTHDPRLAKTYLFGKLLMVLLLEQLTEQVRLKQPEWFADPLRPVSLWLMTGFWKEGLRQLLVGHISLVHFQFCIPALERIFRIAPRSRLQQLAFGQALLEHLSCSLYPPPPYDGLS
jgi:hypothetical protein